MGRCGGCDDAIPDVDAIHRRKAVLAVDVLARTGGVDGERCGRRVVKGAHTRQHREGSIPAKASNHKLDEYKSRGTLTHCCAEGIVCDMDCHARLCRARRAHQSTICVVTCDVVPWSVLGTRPPLTKAVVRMAPSQLLCFSPRRG